MLNLVVRRETARLLKVQDQAIRYHHTLPRRVQFSRYYVVIIIIIIIIIIIKLFLHTRCHAQKFITDYLHRK
jgi:hypothetical protein